MFRIVCAAQTTRADDAAQVALHQRDACALHRHVGARAHRDADVRLRERGGVIDAVARHRHEPPLACSRLTTSPFWSGSTSAIDLVDAERLRHGLGGRPAVAGQHHDADAFALQGVDRFGGDCP